MPITPSSILALDVGEKRIGVAIASHEARLPSPLTTFINDEHFLDNLIKLVKERGVGVIVVGLPRGLDGQTTAQTEYVERFAKVLEGGLSLPIHFQDEALTSTKAESELRARGRAYTKEEVDALSATYILEDFLQGGSA